jgi:hypothetical protein
MHEEKPYLWRYRLVLSYFFQVVAATLFVLSAYDDPGDDRLRLCGIYILIYAVLVKVQA